MEQPVGVVIGGAVNGVAQAESQSAEGRMLLAEPGMAARCQPGFQGALEGRGGFSERVLQVGALGGGEQAGALPPFRRQRHGYAFEQEDLPRRVKDEVSPLAVEPGDLPLPLVIKRQRGRTQQAAHGLPGLFGERTLPPQRQQGQGAG